MPATDPVPTARQIGADDRRDGGARLPYRSPRLLDLLAVHDTTPLLALTLRRAYLDGWDNPDATPALTPVHDHDYATRLASCPACAAGIPYQVEPGPDPDDAPHGTGAGPLTLPERRTLGCQCWRRPDGTYDHLRTCPVPAVDALLAARPESAPTA